MYMCIYIYIYIYIHIEREGDRYRYVYIYIYIYSIDTEIPNPADIEGNKPKHTLQNNFLFCFALTAFTS